MRIQGSGMSMYTNYTSYLNHNNQNSVAESQKNQNFNQQIDIEKTKPPPPKPPQMNIDTNNDDLWSEEEISEFIESENLETSASEIIGKYDADGDSTINTDEREAMRSDDAFNLKDKRPDGLGGPRRNPPPELAMMEEDDEEASEDTITNLFLKQFQTAYMNTSRVYTDVNSIFDVIL